MAFSVNSTTVNSAMNSTVNIPGSTINPVVIRVIPPQYSHSIKIINPKKKSEFTVANIASKEKFKSVNQLKEYVMEKFDGQVNNPINQIGYIEPGHGLRGKQRWLTSDNDIDEMYQLCNLKKEIIFWTFLLSPVSKKRRTDDDDTEQQTTTKGKKSSRYEVYVDKMAEVDEIQEKLEEIHSSDYTKEQIRAWAHLIHLKKHDSFDIAPDKPFWRNTRKTVTSNSTISPSKRINLRGQCVTQLQKWHELLERGAITQAQYDEFQATILRDIKNF